MSSSPPPAKRLKPSSQPWGVYDACKLPIVLLSIVYEYGHPLCGGCEEDGDVTDVHSLITMIKDYTLFHFCDLPCLVQGLQQRAWLECVHCDTNLSCVRCDTPEHRCGTDMICPECHPPDCDECETLQEQVDELQGKLDTIRGAL